MKRYRVRGFAESELDIQAEALEPDDPWRVALARYEAGVLTVTPETAQEVAGGLTELANLCDDHAEDRASPPETRRVYRAARDGLSTLAGKIRRDFKGVR